MEVGKETTITLQLNDDTRLSDAVALRGLLARRHQEKVTKAEVRERVVAFIGQADYKEYEAGHGLAAGYFDRILEAMAKDLEEKGAISAVSGIKTRPSQEDSGEFPEILLSARDLYWLAQRVLNKEVSIKGIGPRRATNLKDVSGLWLVAVDDDAEFDSFA